jgi:hypothetical protein
MTAQTRARTGAPATADAQIKDDVAALRAESPAAGEGRRTAGVLSPGRRQELATWMMCGPS